jgi:hypothetical protein
MQLGASSQLLSNPSHQDYMSITTSKGTRHLKLIRNCSALRLWLDINAWKPPIFDRLPGCSTGTQSCNIQGSRWELTSMLANDTRCSFSWWKTISNANLCTSSLSLHMCFITSGRTHGVSPGKRKENVELKRYCSGRCLAIIKNVQVYMDSDKNQLQLRGFMPEIHVHTNQRLA